MMTIDEAWQRQPRRSMKWIATAMDDGITMLIDRGATDTEVADLLDGMDNSLRQIVPPS